MRVASPSGEVTMADPEWTPDADLNFDGVIDDADRDLLTGLVSNPGVPKEIVPGELWRRDSAFLRGLTIGYAGAPYDREARASLMRNRWYSPTLGRFISRDPAGYIDGMSLHQYVTGNPLKYWDPFGLACEVNWHHMLPQEFRKQFKAAGVNIDSKEFGWLMHGANDHRPLHDAGWNDDWGKFFETEKDKGRKVTKASIRKKLADLSGDEQYKHILARGAEPTKSSYGQWGKVKDKDAEFAKAREKTLNKVRNAGGKTGRVGARAAKGIARKIPIIAGVFFITDVASGEPLDKAAANAVMIVDVDTVKHLGEAGQQYSSDLFDSQKYKMDGRFHRQFEHVGGDIIREYRPDR